MTSILRVLAIVALNVATASAGTILFTFDGDSTGTHTTFSDSLGGLRATFSSSVDTTNSGGFTISQSFFTLLTGNILEAGGQTSVPLAIDFSSPLSSISLVFATATLVPDTFQMDAFNGSNAVGTVTAQGTPMGTPFPEGSVSLSGLMFNRIVLSTPSASVFAIDNLAVTEVPEPFSVFLVGVGLASMGYHTTRRRCH